MELYKIMWYRSCIGYELFKDGESIQVFPEENREMSWVQDIIDNGNVAYTQV